MTTATTEAPPGREGMSDRASNHTMRWWILAVLGVAQLMVILDNTIVNIALPTAQHDLGFSNADRQWIVTAYSLAFGSLLLLGGRIGDIIGRKRALIIGLVGFAVASAIGGAAVDFPMLVIARTVQGAFGALLAPSVLALLTTTFSDPAERGKAFGIYGGIAGAGGALGLLLGGILTSYASWRWTLFVNLAFAAVATVGALLWLKNDKAADHDPLDLPGLALVTGGLFSLVYGFSHAETTAWSNPFTIGFLVLGVVLLAAFALLETRVTLPAPPAPRRAQPDPGRVHAGHAVRQHRDLRGLPVPHLLPAGDPGLQPGEDRRGLPARWSPRWPPWPRCPTASSSPGSDPSPSCPIGLALRRRRPCTGSIWSGSHSSYVTHVLPYIVLLGLRVRAEPRPLVQHRHPRAGPPRRRRRIGHPQHHPAGRGVDRDRPAQHPGRRGRHRLPGRQGPDPREPEGGRPAQLHDGVPVVVTHLRGSGRWWPVWCCGVGTLGELGAPDHRVVDL